MRERSIAQRERVSVNQHRARHRVLSTTFTRSPFGIPPCYRFCEKPSALTGFSFRVKHAPPFPFVVYISCAQSPNHHSVYSTHYPPFVGVQPYASAHSAEPFPFAPVRFEAQALGAHCSACAANSFLEAINQRLGLFGVKVGRRHCASA